MKLCVIRDRFLNPWDISNYYGLIKFNDVELTFAHCLPPTELERFMGRFPGAKFMNYGDQPQRVLEQGFDVLDIPDMFYDFSRYFVRRHERVVHVAWDNLPARSTIHFDHTGMLSMAWKHVARSHLARYTLELLGMPASNIEVIPGAVDVSLFHPGDEREKVALFVGRNVPEKGLTHAIWGLSGVDASLWVVGGYLTQEQRHWWGNAGPLKIKDFGFVEPHILAAFMRQARCLVLPTMPLVSPDPNAAWLEQFGQVLIEAMASGTPIVAYDSGAVKEVVGETGVLVTCGDWSLLGLEVKQFLDNDTHFDRYSRLARNRALLLYDQVVVADAIRRWYFDG